MIVLENISEAPSAFDQQIAQLRVAPQSIEAESSVLGGLLLNNDTWDRVADLLTEGDFYNHTHRQIYAAMASLINASRPADVITVFEHLQSLGKAEETGGLAYLNALAQYVPSAGNIRRYAEIVRERAILRKLVTASDEIATSAFNPQGSTIDQILDAAQARIMAISEARSAGSSDDWVDAYTASVQHTELLERRHEGQTPGMSTGLPDLDELLDGGLQRGNLVVIGARPGMGKSAIGMTIALHVAAGHSVGFFSMEMPHTDLRDRMAAMLGYVPISALRRPGKFNLDYNRILDSADRAKGLRFHVTDKSSLNILQVRAKARALKRKAGLDMMVVDYIGLMPGTDPKMPRAYQIEEITKGLKSLAKELEIVVVALAQVNRGVAERADQMPMLSDLRDSGSIEQDADIVAFISRPIVSKPDLPADFLRYGLLRVAKNRQGRLGDVHLHYQGDQTRFSSWEGPAPSRQPATKRRGDL